MQIFTVGGAIRDELLGLPVQDRDHVVVGASPEEMRALGFKPVGKDFPVFLHPTSHEEYALARTERKTGHGYKGFAFHAAPEVSLEEDLARRDLTINAIARAADGTLIDPYGGVADLQAKVLRHVGPAFVEDPVRVLRLARFAARFADFSVAPATMDLMRQMVTAGEVDHLVAERVWQELAKGLMERHPARLFAVLRDCGALARLLPEVDRLFGVPQRADFHPEVDTGVHVMLVVEQAAQTGQPLPVRFAALLHDLGKGLTPASDLPRHPGHEQRSVRLAAEVCARLKVPGDCRDLALLVARAHGDIHRAGELSASTIVKLLASSDALRRPARFEQLLAVCACDFHGRLGWQDVPYAAPEIFRQSLTAMRAVDAAAIARQCSEPAKIAALLHQERIRAVKKALADRD
ncbi:MAG TPA: multifunctional CCA addition/repair protein [Accumulibacter sp.]|nr:multifunctional CCA addition/repair protein [Accumulibacter sp.]